MGGGGGGGGIMINDNLHWAADKCAIDAAVAKHTQHKAPGHQPAESSP